MTHEGLGDRCKRFEGVESNRSAMKGLPLLARLDGRAFHTFTRKLARPYDERLSSCMLETTRFLVEEMQACIGYTQSDEITLLWHVPSQGPSGYLFDGRFQKIASISAGLASVQFARLIQEKIPEKSHYLPCFDCRVWQVPTPKEALEVFIWREDDATKNSISMAAQVYYSHHSLYEKNSSEKQELLFQKGINWNNYPSFFKRGVYVQRRKREQALTEEILQRIPPQHRPPVGQLFIRSEVVALDLPPIRRVENAIQVLFEGTDPVVRKEASRA